MTVVRTWTTTGTGINDIPNDNKIELTRCNPTREQYERDLKRRQDEHLKRVQENSSYESAYEPPWQACLHDQCTECHGTGVKFDGSMCVHNISCPCPKCSAYYSTS